MSDAVRCEGLEVRYGDVVAVAGIDLRVPKGALFGFLGPNGAGKSSTLSVLCTLRRPTVGRATVAGFDCVRQPAEVRARIGVIFQEPTLDDRLTGRENLLLHARVYGVPRGARHARIEEAIEWSALGDAVDRQVRTYSGGMKRRLELARVLLHRPEVLFLDEPTVGLDPQTRRHFWERLESMRRECGVTLLLTTHYMEEAERADLVAIIDRGRIVAHGTPGELKELVPADCVREPVAAVPAPSLEDVFVHLTGRDLRQESASAHQRVRDAMARRGVR